MVPIVTLTTDFGARDSYVAAMKGVILGIAREARLVDVSHEVAAHDVTEAALALEAAAPFFPAGTVHLAVVDPGVGTARGRAPGARPGARAARPARRRSRAPALVDRARGARRGGRHGAPRRPLRQPRDLDPRGGLRVVRRGQRAACGPRAAVRGDLRRLDAGTGRRAGRRQRPAR